VKRLADKVAIITGAAQGQGAAEAKLFAHEGAKVVLTDLKDAGINAAAELGDDAIFLQHDVGDEDDWQRVVQTSVDRFGRIDILINNAGFYVPRSLQETTRTEMDRHYVVNQLGVFLGMQSVAPVMEKTGGGVIINVSSAAAFRGNPNMFAYSATKWAIRGMTRCAARDLAPLNIRVNTVLPGLIDTPMFQTENSPTQRDFLVSQVPSGRIGKVDDVAELILFICSDAARYVNGAEIAIDGAIAA